MLHLFRLALAAAIAFPTLASSADAVRLAPSARFFPAFLPDGRVGLSAALPTAADGAISCRAGANVSGAFYEANAAEQADRSIALAGLAGAALAVRGESRQPTIVTPCLERDDQGPCLEWGAPYPVATYKMSAALPSGDLLWAECSRNGTDPISAEEVRAGLSGFLEI